MAVFESPFWKKKRVFSEAEALFDLIVFCPKVSFYNLSVRWGWHRQKVKRFLDACDGFVTLCVTRTSLKNNALQGFCDAHCDGFVTDLKEQEENKEKRSKKENKEEKEIYTPLHTNVCIPPSPFEKFKVWVLENAPRVSRMKEPFTEAQFLKAKEVVGTEEMQRLLTAMHNYEPLTKKNVSAYLTLMNWWRRDAKSEKGDERRPYRVMTYEEMLTTMDRERIPMSAFSPLHIGNNPKPMWVKLTDKKKFKIPDKICDT